MHDQGRLGAPTLPGGGGHPLLQQPRASMTQARASIQATERGQDMAFGVTQSRAINFYTGGQMPSGVPMPMFAKKKKEEDLSGSESEEDEHQVKMGHHMSNI